MGKFSTYKFRPAWFASKGVKRDCEYENAKSEIVATEITRFEIGYLLKVEILRNRCELKAFQKP